MNIAVLVSGSGSNLQAIINAIENEVLMDVKISCVIADRNCYAIERATKAKIPTWTIDKKNDFNTEIHTICIQNNVDIIVLAGFLSILNHQLCKKWNKRIINLHPSLLPKFGGEGMYGNHVHKAVIKNQEKESGASVHYVTSGIDEGEIIAQMKFKIEPHNTWENVAQKVSEIEKPLLISVIDKLSKKSYN